MIKKNTVPRLAVLVGNPRRHSRTLALAHLVAQAVSHRTGARHLGTLDLCEHADAIFRPSDQALDAATKNLATADLLVVASPTYKGSYTGLLKAFLDRYATNALSDTTALPVMTGAGPRHAMAVDYTLTPLLSELGASVPIRGLFVDIERFESVPTTVTAWADANLHTLERSMALPHDKELAP